MTQKITDDINNYFVASKPRALGNDAMYMQMAWADSKVPMISFNIILCKCMYTVYIVNFLLRSMYLKFMQAA